jgi:hypothetical protein
MCSGVAPISRTLTWGARFSFQLLPRQHKSYSTSTSVVPFPVRSTPYPILTGLYCLTGMSCGLELVPLLYVGLVPRIAAPRPKALMREAIRDEEAEVQIRHT